MLAFELPFDSRNEAGTALSCPPGRFDSEAGALRDQIARGGRLDDEQLVALLAAALREVDSGVVVCGSSDRTPSILVLGRRRLNNESGSGTTFACSVDGLGAVAEARAGDTDRALLALVFIDIVASTETAERVGDDAWRSLLDRYRDLVRRRLTAARGTEIDSAGDGFFATFDAPARAIRCAEEIVLGLARIGISVRAGVHAGECAVARGRVSGVAVHVAARIVEIASPGEILVSGTLRDLVAGSGLEFVDRDWHALRGLTGSRQLFALLRHMAPGESEPPKLASIDRVARGA